MNENRCSGCHGVQPERMTMTPDGAGGFLCYPCKVGGVKMGRVVHSDIPQTGGSIRKERDLHKRLANEAGHEWQPM